MEGMELSKVTAVPYTGNTIQQVEDTLQDI